MLLGRIRMDDLLSGDRRSWVIAESLSDLIPPELIAADDRKNNRQLVEAQLQVDERKGERRTCDGCKNRNACQSERRSQVDRRQVDGRQFVSSAPEDAFRSHRFGATPRLQIRTFLLSVLLATLVLAWFTPAVN